MLGRKVIKSLPCLLMGKLRHSEEKPPTLNPSGEIGGYTVILAFFLLDPIPDWPHR